MKRILLTLALGLAILTTNAQTTINPDTVCVNATGEQYFVTNTATSTYNWTITGGGSVLQTKTIITSTIYHRSINDIVPIHIWPNNN